MKQPVARHFRANLSRPPCAQKLEKLSPYPFARKAGKARPLADGGGASSGIERAFAKLGRKAEKSQDAQIVFGDAPRRLADKAHLARCYVVEAASVIKKLS